MANTSRTPGAPPANSPARPSGPRSPQPGKTVSAPPKVPKGPGPLKKF